MSKYTELGYVEADYIGNAESVEPLSKIVSFTYSFTLDGEDITKFVDGFSIDKQLGRAYHTAQMKLINYSLDNKYLRSEEYLLSVAIGADSYEFVLFDADRDYKNDIALVLKTKGCLLAEPFSFAETTTYSDTDFISLVNTLTESDTIKIFNNAPNFTFNNKSYTKNNGSNLDAIFELLNIFGGVIYDNDEGIVISKSLTIEEGASPDLILNDDILEYKKMSDNFDGSKALGAVIFNEYEYNRRDDTNPVAVQDEQRMKLHYRSCNDTEAFVTFSPIPNSYSYVHLGNNFRDKYSSLTNKKFTHRERVIDSEIILLENGIYKILSIKVDGEILSRYAYEFRRNFNAVKFREPLLGAVDIEYESKVVFLEELGYFNRDTNERFVEILYNGCSIQEFISCENDSDGNSNDNSQDYKRECLINADSEFSSEKTSYIYAEVGAIEKLFFYTNSEDNNSVLIDTKEGMDLTASDYITPSFIQNITITKEPKMMKAEFERIDLTAELSVKLANASYYYIGFKSKLNNILLDGRSVVKRTFDDVTYYYNPTVDKAIINRDIGTKVSGKYQKEILTIEIPACGFNNKVRGVKIVSDCKPMDIKYNSELNGDLSCVIPQTIKVNLANELGVSQFFASGKEVTLDGVSYTVDTDGTIDVLVEFKRKYIIACSSLAGVDASVTIDASNAIKDDA